MTENMLSVNLPNFITVCLMAAVGFALFAFAAQAFHWGNGQWGGGSSSSN